MILYWITLTTTPGLVHLAKKRIADHLLTSRGGCQLASRFFWVGGLTAEALEAPIATMARRVLVVILVMIKVLL